MSLIIKDGDSVDRYYQVIEDGTSGNPFQSVVPSFAVASAIREISNSYGDDVSIWEKAKSLIKFGRNSDIDTGVQEMVWEQGGFETLPTGNDIDIIVSTDAGDTQDVVIEGHTISGSDLTFVTQTATLNGTTNVTLTTPLYRANRLYNNDSTDFAGTVTVEDNGTSVHLSAAGNVNQSLKCATATSQFDYWIVTGFEASVNRNASAAVDFELQIMESGKVFRTKYYLSTGTGTTFIPFDQPLIVKPNSDVRVLATSNTNNTSVGASIHGHLAIIT